MAAKKSGKSPPPAKSSKDKKSEAAPLGSVKAIWDVVEGKYGEGTVTRGDEIFKNERVSFGSYSVDFITGGGVPQGRIIEVFGEESTGKTSLALLTAGEYIAAGKDVHWIDVENDWDESSVKWGLRHRVPVDKILVYRPDSGEKALQIARIIAEQKADALIVIDSWAAISSSEEIESAPGDYNVAPNARLCNQFIRQFQTALNSPYAKTTLFVINQQRDAIGGMGRYKITPGGRMLKYAAAIRLEMRRLGFVDQQRQGIKITIGQEMGIKAVKNKTFPPRREAKPIFYVAENKFGTIGFDNVRDMTRYGLMWGRVIDVKAKKGKVKPTEAGLHYIDENGEIVRIGKDENQVVYQLNKPDNLPLFMDFKAVMLGELQKAIIYEKDGVSPDSDDVDALKEVEEEEAAIEKELSEDA